MSTPLFRLASLDLIRGFVAVGRRMSITLAAQDLCLSQSAVSRQIQALEAAVGAKLLTRGHRSIRFTAEGERLFRAADGALLQLQDAVSSLAAGYRRPVTITTSVGVAALWLLPRLGQLQAQHPDIDLRVAATNKVLDLHQEGVDLAIRYCDDSKAPWGAQKLFSETVVPVAHPSFATKRLKTAADLASLVLLEYEEPGRPWLHWEDVLNASGLSSGMAKGVLRFNQYDQVIQAALAGQGVALGRHELIEPMLADGRLTLLKQAQHRPSGGHAYWLVQADPKPRKDVRDLVQWIRAQAQALAAKT